MKKYNKYIIVGSVFLMGLAIGWLGKSSLQLNPEVNKNHVHSTTEEQNQSNEIWTCSMHPQVRQNESGICPICEMDLIPLDNSTPNEDPSILKMSKEASKLAQIETYLIEDNSSTRVTKSDIYADGTVELDERTIQSQTAHLAGRIETMNITFEGQYVKKGQKIAQLYSVDVLAASQELITASKYKNSMNGILEASMQKLRNWKISEDLINEILRTEKPITTLDIFADQSGYVLRKMVAQGDYLTQGDVMYTVGTTATVWLVFQIFESDISSVHVGSKITFSTSSSPYKTMTAVISYINPTLNEKTRTVSVRAEINNRNNFLKPGMVLRGHIERQSASNSSQKITIPNTAILWTGERSVVYTQLPDVDVPTFQFNEVEVSDRGKEFSTIERGLSIGDNIVVHGAFAVDASAQLSNKLSMMNRQVQIKEDALIESIPNFTDSIPDELKLKLDGIISKYLTLKDALVATNQDNASREAALFEESLDQIDMSAVSQEVSNYWLSKEKSLRSHSIKIKNGNSIEDQRRQFNFLSDEMIQTIKAFGTSEKTYFIQHCPMAENNEGADWISREKEIQNPYFGDKMMKCGFIKLELN
ncbi:MAG: efflux RND transporter periplasmic adaptor subunit [Saprospiraceae bacterium]|nr:efflux RND transporter periplasmic adaptor subunit [Saprospiraceae bacterium]